MILRDAGKIILNSSELDWVVDEIKTTPTALPTALAEGFECMYSIQYSSYYGKPYQACKHNSDNETINCEGFDLLSDAITWCEEVNKSAMGLRIAELQAQSSKIEAEIASGSFQMGTPSVDHAGENKEVKPSTGQTWTHKQKGYDVKIDYINRTGDVVVEEVATGQRDGFGRKAFLERFSPKSKEGDA